MTNQLWDFFDITETNKLFNELIDTQDISIKEDSRNNPVILTDKIHSESEQENSVNESIHKEQVHTIPDKKPATIKHESPSKEKNSLENALIDMCRKGGFYGAVIADLNGLPLAVYNSPVDGDVIAAYTSILGESLEKASHFLNQPEANNISMDINILDKIVLRKFLITGISYYLMIISPKNIDEKAEIEAILTQIPQLLS